MRSAALLLLVACGGSSNATPDPDSPPADSAPPDVMHLDKSAGCVSNFGNALTNGYGRLDGTVVAVLAPGNTSCPRPNNDHLILEVRMGGAVYRLVAAVESSFGEPKMAFASKAAPLAGPAWSDGWHPDLDFDYVTHLGLHRLDFAPMPIFDLADALTGPIVPGAKISVFATVENSDDSAHLIHRNEINQDGAFVIDPDGSPTYLVTRFDNQLF